MLQVNKVNFINRHVFFFWGGGAHNFTLSNSLPDLSAGAGDDLCTLLLPSAHEIIISRHGETRYTAPPPPLRHLCLRCITTNLGPYSAYFHILSTSHTTKKSLRRCFLCKWMHKSHLQGEKREQSANIFFYLCHFYVLIFRIWLQANSQGLLKWHLITKDLGTMKTSG